MQRSQTVEVDRRRCSQHRRRISAVYDASRACLPSCSAETAEYCSLLLPRSSSLLLWTGGIDQCDGTGEGRQENCGGKTRAVDGKRAGRIRTGQDATNINNRDVNPTCPSAWAPVAYVIVFGILIRRTGGEQLHYFPSVPFLWFVAAEISCRFDEVIGDSAIRSIFCDLVSVSTSKYTAIMYSFQEN